MITYPRLSRKPIAFRSMTSMTPVDFEALLEEFLAAQARRRQAATHTKRSRQPRRRAPGAGHPYAHDDRTRLLMALSGSASTRPTRSSGCCSTRTRANRHASMDTHGEHENRRDERSCNSRRPIFMGTPGRTTSGRPFWSSGWSRSKPGYTGKMRHSGERVTPFSITPKTADTSPRIGERRLGCTTRWQDVLVFKCKTVE